eukprot:gene5439-6783_t
MKFLILLLCLFSVFVFVSAGKTPLEEFVEKPDEGTSYYIHRTYQNPKYTAYVLNFSSINWLTANETSNPRWWHFLTICVPNLVLSDYGYLDINAGSYSFEMPDKLGKFLEDLCIKSNTVVSQIFQVPNQPLIFDNDNVSRIEDGILAYTWMKYLDENASTEWIGQFALTKSVVRAMDVIQEFVKSKSLFHRVNNFVISGASKRGWTSWLVASVDPRVKAVIPMVLPLLNLVENSNTHFRALGGWSFAYGDYVAQNLMSHVNDGGFDKLGKQIDALQFVDKLSSVKKYVVTAVSDQFFIPDSANFFWHKLLGVKNLRIHPNTDHGLQERVYNLIDETITYYRMIVNNNKIPEIDWSIVPDLSTNTTTIVVTTKTDCAFSPKPSKVVVYQADTISTVKRDWRLKTCGINVPECKQNITWVETPIQEVSKDLYKFTVEAPSRGGWRGAFLEFTYPSIYGDQKYTSDFFYAPFTLPFPSCGLKCGNKDTSFQ